MAVLERSLPVAAARVCTMMNSVYSGAQREEAERYLLLFQCDRHTIIFDFHQQL